MLRNIILRVVVAVILGLESQVGFAAPTDAACDALSNQLKTARIRTPLQMTDRALATLIFEIQSSEIWLKAEGVVVGGSRTHFDMGYGPRADRPSDLDISVFPAHEPMGDSQDDKDVSNMQWQIELSKFRSKLRDPLKAVGIDEVDIFFGAIHKQPPLPLSVLIDQNKITSRTEQEAAWNRVLVEKESPGGLPVAFARYVGAEDPYTNYAEHYLMKQLFVGYLQDKVGGYIPILTYQNVILIRDAGASSLLLKKRLESLGYAFVIILP